jgi:cysteine desulfurase
MIYLDNNASTPIDPFVVEAIKNELSNLVNNPSSPHQFGQSAKARLDKARRIIADYFKVKPTEVIFTSSGTEAMNLLIQGLIANRKGHVVSSEMEHSCVYNLLKERSDLETTFVKPDYTGTISIESVLEAVRPDTLLVALMAVNNETGTKTDIAAIASKLKIPFVVDGVQWLGKEPIALPPNITGIGFSGHKIHAPGGIGFIIVKGKIASQIRGGFQEFGKRAGTENMIGISGLAKAIQRIEYPNQNMRDHFETIVLKALPDARVNGANRVGTTSNICFPGIDGESLLIKLDQMGVAASLGSACSSGAIEPSRVLVSMGLSYNDAKSSLRFSFSRMNTLDDAVQAADIVIRAVQSFKK